MLLRKQFYLNERTVCDVNFSMDRTPLAPSDRGEIIPTEISQCLNPDCLQINFGHPYLCHACQEKLLLAERYRALNYIGAGGFAYTFEAVDEHRLQTTCVIKEFVPRELSEANKQQAINLFRQEAAILKNLGNHPQIPDLLAFLPQQQRLYLVQEFISGQNLLQILHQRGRFSQEQVKQILLNLLPVLEFIHDKQVIHRDIKPSNIIRQQDNNLVLIDFGSSLQSSREFLTQIGAITGTPGYVAPEQIKGQATSASDLFSLGATALHLLTGIMPPDRGIDLSSTTLDVIWSQAEISPNPEFSQIIAKLLQPDLAKRYQSAIEVEHDLATLPLLKETNSPKTVAVDKAPVNNNFSQTIDSNTVILTGVQKNNEIVDYQNLEQLLAKQNYLEADRETWRLLLQIADRRVQGCLTLKDIIRFPTEKLIVIDRLWQQYSNGQFGLIIQRKIYQDLQINTSDNYSTWQKFAEKVGWYKQDNWLKYSELTFDIRGCKGHLPAYCIDVFNRHNINRGVCSWWRLGFIALINRLEQNQEYQLN